MSPSKQSNIKTKKRMLVFLIVCALLVIALMGRLGYIQLVKGDEYRKLALNQQTRDRIISSNRGSILDRNGKELAVSASVETVSIAPNTIQKAKKQEEVAKALSEILELDYETVLAKTNKNSSYEYIKKKVEKETCDKIRKLNLTGVNLDADTKRYYIYGSLASHVIGFVGTDNQGLNGIERVMDSELKGKPGRVVSAKNANGGDMPLEYEKYYESEDGLNVVLTIDEVIQHFAEKHLEQAVKDNAVANGASCIIADPKTGEILAMATYPSYDLNSPFTITNESVKAEIDKLEGEEKTKRTNEELQKMWRNKAIVDSYEPGSTFKIITSSIAIEEKLVNYTETFNCPGYAHVGNYNISCWKHQGHGTETFVQGVQNSCNPVFIELGRRIGTSKFYKYYKAFGFTQKTGIEIPGEQEGLFHDIKTSFNEVELATCSFGQSFQITPLQLVSAVSAVANDGKLLKPHLIKQLVDSKGNIVKNYEPELVRQVISKDTANTLCKILETVVSEGSAKNAYIKGFRVAGKTGTAEKVPRGTNKVIASFIGFAPADDPQYLCLVMLDEPHGVSTFGGVIAAPVVGRILEDTLRYAGVEAQYTAEEMQDTDVGVPDVLNKTVEEAKEILKNSNLKYRVLGDGETVSSQTPNAYARLTENSTVILYTGEAKPESSVTVPDVIGKSAIEANTILTNANLNIKVTGLKGNNSGAVQSALQEPAAGSSVPPGTVVTVQFVSLDVD